MNQMTDDKLLICNGKGIIPGPVEEAEAFAARVAYCLNIREEMAGKLPFTSDMEASADIMAAPVQEIRSRYDIAPAWVPVFFSNYQLMPWHGGCAWIFQLSSSDPTAAFFQLRKRFQHSPTYLGIYDRDELMAHELSHIGRMMFEEPQFEEILAYRTSKSRLRRWFGPLVQSSKESAWFVFLILPLVLLDLYLLFEGSETLYWKSMWLKLLPLALIVAALFRLWRRQTAFKRALSNIKGVFRHPEAVIYRLTDKEIHFFAKASPSEIQDYITSEKSLRWRVIRLAYC